MNRIRSLFLFLLASAALWTDAPTLADTVGSMTQPTTNNEYRWIWGWDSANSMLRALKVDATGQLYTVGGGTVTGNVADGATESGNPISFAGFYHSGADTYTNGQRVEAHFDSAGNLKVYTASVEAGGDITNNVLGMIPKTVVGSTYALTTYQSAVSGSLVVSGNIFSGAANLTRCWAYNGDAAIRYLWLTNATSAPAGALASSSATVIHVFALAPSTNTPFDFGAAGDAYGTGLSFGFSTSATSYTAGTASEHTFNAQYAH